MNATTKAVWLGHCRTGGRPYLKPDELSPGVNLLGNGADEVASVLSFACSEAGLTTLVLDFGGSISSRASGRLEVGGVGHFLYDSMKLEECASFLSSVAATEGETLGQRMTQEARGSEGGLLIVASLGGPQVQASNAQLPAILRTHQ